MYKMDILHGSIADKLVKFALPIGITGIFEQLFNGADVLILGRFVGTDAMAAVGNNMPVISMLVTLLLGLSLGANVTLAQYLGARRYTDISPSVRTAVGLSVAAGIILCIAGELLTPAALNWLAVPSGVYDMAAVYLQIFLLGLPFISLYNFEAAIFRSCGDGKTPLYSLVITSLLNIVLDMASVLLFNAGIAGIVWSTVISYVINALVLLVFLCRTKERVALVIRPLTGNRDALHSILRIGLPAGVQGMVFALSNMLIQSSLNSLGAEAMAASAAALTIEINVYCFVNGFGQATTTFVGQNYGARNLRRCFRITKEALGVEAAFLAVIVFPILWFAGPLIGVFNPDQAVISLGIIRVFCATGAQYLNGVIEILSGSLRGYGYSLPPAIVALAGICGVRIVWLHTAFSLHPTFLVLMLNYPISWLVTVGVLFWVYSMCRKHIVAGLLHHVGNHVAA